MCHSTAPQTTSSTECSSASNLRGNDTLHPHVHREADKFPRSAGTLQGAIEWMSTWTCGHSAVCHTSAVKTFISSKETINTEMNHQNIINYSFSLSNVFVYKFYNKILDVC